MASAPRAAAPRGGPAGSAQAPTPPGRIFSPRLGGMLRNAGAAGRPAAGLLLASDCLSCVDLANRWSSAAEARAALELPGHLYCNCLSVGDLWLAAEACMKRAARGGFAPPVPLPLPAPVAMSPRPCTPVPSQGLVGNTRAGRKAARAAAATAGAQGSAVDVREEAKLQSCIATLWAAFEAMGEAGNFWGDYMALSPATRPQFRAMTAETLRECPLSTLRGACGVLKRWQAWALEAEAPWTNPSAIVVALWLRSLRTRGPTAAHGALRTLAWLELRIGMRMSTSVALVKQQGSIVG